MSQFHYLVDAVKNLKPGYEMAFDYQLLQINVAPPPWTTADWILESIPGSAYEYSWRRNEKGDVIFRRRLTPLDGTEGLRTYVSADRRHLVEQLPNGLFRPK